MARRNLVMIWVGMLLTTGLILSAANRAPGVAKLVKKAGIQHPASTDSRSNNLARVEKTSFGPAVPKAFGTIAYDNGFATSFPAVVGRSFGNQYDTALNPAGTAIGPVQVSGSVTALQWGMWGNPTQTSWGTFFIEFYGPVSGTTAPFITSFALNGVGGSSPLLVGFTLTTPLNYSGPSFLAAFYNGNSGTSLPNGPCPLFTSTTVGGQGHHGMAINWNPGTGTGFAAIPTANALMRPSGNVLIPVELMNFTVE